MCATADNQRPQVTLHAAEHNMLEVAWGKRGGSGHAPRAGRVSELDTIVLPDQQSRPCLLDEAFVAVAPGSSIRAVCINVCSMH